MSEQTSSIYGKPNFKLIVALFVAAILVLLTAAYFFLRTGVLHMRGNQGHRTGMVLLLPQSVSTVSLLR